MADILRSVVGRLLGLDSQNNLILGGSKIFYGHSTNQDAVIDLTAISSNGGFGDYLAYASPSGAQNNVAPPGFVSTTGFLDVTLAADGNWTGLIAGTNKQALAIRNNPASAGNLELDIQNAGSAAANQFSGVTPSFILTPGATVLLLYYTTPALWMITL